MPQARLFVPQEALEVWLGDGRAVLSHSTLAYGGYSFEVESAVHFRSEVTGSPDAQHLVGRIKTRDQLERLAAEHSGDSVVLGDNAYEVAEGYLLRLLTPTDNSVPLMQKLFAEP